MTATSCSDARKILFPSLQSRGISCTRPVRAKIEKHDLWTRSSGRSSQHLILGFLGLVLGSARVLIFVSVPVPVPIPVPVLVPIPVSVLLFLVPFFLSVAVPFFLDFSSSVLLVSPLLISITSVPVFIFVLLFSVRSLPFRIFRMLQNKSNFISYRRGT